MTLTVRLSPSIGNYKARDDNYQTLINNALREYLNKQQVPLNEEILLRVIREELRSTQ